MHKGRPDHPGGPFRIVPPRRVTRSRPMTKAAQVTLRGLMPCGVAVAAYSAFIASSEISTLTSSETKGANMSSP